MQAEQPKTPKNGESKQQSIRFGLVNKCRLDERNC